MTSKVRCATIGLGMGWNHVRFLSECAEAEVVGVADLNTASFEKVTGVVPIERCFTDYRAMLRETRPDLVTIALPNSLHAAVAIEAMEAGAHVLGEKPMAMNTAEALTIRDAAERLGKRFGLNLRFRFTPQARALKAMADDGFLGECYHAYTRWTRQDGFPGFGGWFGQKRLSGGGPLIDLGVHRLDLALWLMGNPNPVTVSGACHDKVGVPRAQAAGKVFDVEDFATGFVRCDDGSSIIFESSWGNFQEKKEDMYTKVTGTQGALIYHNPAGSSVLEAEYIGQQNGNIVKGTIQTTGAAMDPYSEMARCILTDRPFPASAEDGIRLQKILDGLYLSALEEREVSLASL